MSTWGDAINVSIFGESHGQAIGVVIAGLPADRVLFAGFFARFQM